MFYHYIDILPFLLGTLIVVLGPTQISHKKPMNVFVVFTTVIFLIAQSSWFSAWISGNDWGRDWANYVWFIFNTSTMVVFLWVLFYRKQ